MQNDELEKELAWLYSELNKTDNYIYALGLLHEINQIEKELSSSPPPVAPAQGREE